MVLPAHDFLLSTQNADGGWGHAPQQSSMVEATSAVILALKAADLAGPSARAITWLLDAQHADGGWGYNRDDPESSWATAWALLTLARFGAESAVLDRAVSWLLQVPSLRLTQDELQRDVARTLSIDATLRGWPWGPKQAAWVEPTALSMLALQMVLARPPITERLAEGVQYLVDRRCQGGGWNFGNPVMLGTPFPPRAHPTAWTILALYRQAPEAVTPQDRDALRRDMQIDGGVPALAWGLLALRALGEDDPASVTRLAGLQGQDGSWHQNPYHTALALLASSKASLF